MFEQHFGLKSNPFDCQAAGADVFVGPQTPWGWIGVIPLLTAIIGWCPAYLPFGISTCSTKK